MKKQSTGITILLILVVALAAALIVCVVRMRQDASGGDLPALHEIPYAPSLDTLDDEDGADAFDHTLDHPGSRYYAINDFYNMKSGGSLHIIPEYETYQQTTEYSCGCAAALTVLWHYGVTDYSEMQLCEMVRADPEHGTSVENLAALFETLGFPTESHADTDARFASPEECEEYLLEMIDGGIPVLVDWVDWAGHWQAVIGLDTCGTDSPYDDVLILADPYDVTDHYQDGYYIYPFGRFFYMWQEGPVTANDARYEQPFVTVRPKLAA